MSPSFRDISLRARVPSSVVTNAAKYAEGAGVAEEEEDIEVEVLLLPDVDWIVDSSATSSCAGFFWWAKFEEVCGRIFNNST